MKIGLIIYGSLDTVSGGYLYDRKLVEYLRAQGDTIEVISLPWRSYAAHLTDNFTFRIPSNLDILIQDELNHPSLINVNSKPRPYPIVSLVHHLRHSELRAKWKNGLYRIVEKRYLQRVDGFIFNSRTTEGVVNNTIKISKPSIIAFPPTDRFGEKITEDEIKIRAKQKPFRILFLGNVMERKGVHVLINAVKGLKFDVQVEIIGALDADSVYAKSMQRQVEAAGLTSVVHFYGALNNDPLIEKLKQAHVLVVPSSYEGFGIVYLEGMGFGLPAIGTTSGAASEIIANDVTGYLIPPEDSEMLAVRLNHLASDRDALFRISVSALKRYRIQPTWDQTAKSIRQFLEKLISG